MNLSMLMLKYEKYHLVKNQLTLLTVCGGLKGTHITSEHSTGRFGIGV